jgi:hypothetical protein
VIVTRTDGTYGAGRHRRDRRPGRSSTLVYAKRHVEGAFAAVSVFAVPRHFLGMAASSLRRGILTSETDRHGEVTAAREPPGAAAQRPTIGSRGWFMTRSHLRAPHAFGDEGLGRDRPISPASNYRIATATSVSFGVIEALEMDDLRVRGSGEDRLLQPLMKRPSGDAPRRPPPPSSDAARSATMLATARRGKAGAAVLLLARSRGGGGVLWIPPFTSRRECWVSWMVLSQV